MKELPLQSIIKSLTLKRLTNAAKAVSAFVISSTSKKPVTWGKPFILTVEPTNLCNLRCPLCVTGNGSMQRTTGFMDFRTFKQIIDDAEETLIYLLLYQQGEPFLHKDFLQFVTYAKSKQICVATSSNGHYFSEEVANKTVASGLDSLIVSIDGIDQKSYETYRVGGNLDHVLQGVRNLVSEKRRQKSKTPHIQLQFLVMHHNEHQVKAMRELARELGADNFLIKSVQVETLSEAAVWLPQRESFKRYKNDNGELRLKRTGKGSCPRPWTSSLVNWDGSIAPCCFDKHGHFTFGKIDSKNHLKGIWESTDYAHFRETILRNRQSIDICANCTQGVHFYF